jgi:hypothetical protein
MKILKQTEEYRTDSEEEAIAVIESYKKDSEEKGYVLGASGYTYKTKKAKGEIIDEAWVVKVTKILGGVWDDGE